MAELVPSGIFCLQPSMVLQRSEHISLRKTPVFMSIQLQSINNCLSIKMNSKLNNLVEVAQRLAFSLIIVAAWHLGCLSPMGSKVFFPFFSFSCFGNHFKKMNNFQQLKKVGLRF